MLQLIFGAAASGKTGVMMNMIRDAAMSDKSIVLLVPEQFSYETEKSILHLLGDKRAALVDVVSFSKICDEVERKIGGGCGTVLDDGRKLILLNRAVKSAATELEIWSRYSSSFGFLTSLLDTIEELKLNAVSADMLATAAQISDNISLSKKLKELAFIYSHYNAVVSESFIDPTDNLTKLYNSLADYKFFKGKTVFIDSFKGFTGQQFKVLERIISQADDVTVCLSNRKDNTNPFGIFKNIRTAAERIKKIAAAYAVKCCDDIYVEGNYFTSPSLSAVERLLSNGEIADCENDGCLNICKAQTIYDEAEFAARNIRRLVREEGYRFGDFVVIARNADKYEDAVLSALDKNGISCFFDKRIPLSAFAPIVGITAALDAIEYFSSEDILRFLKSGIGTLMFEEISELENYVFLWNINGKKWLEEWDMSPNGFVTNDESNGEEISEKIRLINKLRLRAVEPLVKLKEKFGTNARSMSLAIMNFFEQCGTKQNLLSIRDRLKNENKKDEADALGRSYDSFIEILNSFVDCYGERELSRSEFCEALKKTISLSDIGVTPQLLDQVSFGSADRIRPSRPKVAFILGANLGEFPKAVGAAGLFGIAERKQLRSLDIEIPDRGILAAIDEDFLVYTNLCCATERLYLCYSQSSASGIELEPAAFIEQISANLPCNHFSEPDKLTTANLPETAAAAFSEVCLRYSDDKAESATLLMSLEDNDSFKNRADAVFKAGKKGDDSLTAETAKKLYNSELYMSASRFDVYHRCKFRHFCQYGLKASSLQNVDFKPNQRGLIVHYVLQKLIEKYGKGIADISDNEITVAVDEYIKEYLLSIPGYYSAENEYMRFLTENIARSTKDVALHLKHEFAQSDFEPKYCELHFGDKGESAAIIPFEGGNIHLRGMIDRVDVYDGYIRIVDYKTGSRSFRLSDIIVGQNLQMLMYLYAILKKDEFSELSPAGILYMPAKREKGDEKKLRMNGLLKGDEELVRHMERENEGRFVPQYRLTKDGTLYKSSASSFLPEKGFDTVFEYIDRLLKETGEGILSGDISIDPIDGAGNGGKACKYCDFSAVCRIEEAKAKKAPSFDNDEVLRIISGEEEEYGEIQSDSSPAAGN